MARNSRFFIRSVKQIRSLSVPARPEIVDAIAALRRCSASEIAKNLGKPADGLYYHLRFLLKAGLIVVAGKRETTRRDEILYELPFKGRDYRIRYDPDDSANVRAVNQLVKSMTSVAARDFAGGFVPGLAKCSGENRNLWAARTVGWLSREERKEVKALLARLLTLMDQPRTPDRHYLQALTFVWTPAHPAPIRRKSRR